MYADKKKPKYKGVLIGGYIACAAIALYDWRLTIGCAMLVSAFVAAWYLTTKNR